MDSLEQMAMALEEQEMNDRYEANIEALNKFIRLSYRHELGQSDREIAEKIFRVLDGLSIPRAEAILHCVSTDIRQGARIHADNLIS